MLWGLGPGACVSARKKDGESSAAQRPGRGKKGSCSRVGASDCHRGPWEGAGTTEKEPGPTGTGTGRSGMTASRKKQGRGQATKTGTYLRRGLGEGSPGGGCASRLPGLMVDYLISGAWQQGEPSGRREGLLFPLQGALSLQRERGGERARWREVEVSERGRACVCGRLCTHRCPGDPGVEMCARVCVHVDPGRLRCSLCPQTHCENMTPVCLSACPHASMCECAREQVEMRHTGMSTGDTGLRQGLPWTVTTPPQLEGRAGPREASPGGIPSLVQGAEPTAGDFKHRRSKRVSSDTARSSPCAAASLLLSLAPGASGRSCLPIRPSTQPAPPPGPGCPPHQRGWLRGFCSCGSSQVSWVTSRGHRQRG